MPLNEADKPDAYPILITKPAPRHLPQSRLPAYQLPPMITTENERDHLSCLSHGDLLMVRLSKRKTVSILSTVCLRHIFPVP